MLIEIERMPVRIVVTETKSDQCRLDVKHDGSRMAALAQVLEQKIMSTTIDRHIDAYVGVTLTLMNAAERIPAFDVQLATNQAEQCVR